MLLVLLAPAVAFTDDPESKLDDQVGKGDEFVASSGTVSMTMSAIGNSARIRSASF